MDELRVADHGERKFREMSSSCEILTREKGRQRTLSKRMEQSCEPGRSNLVLSDGVGLEDIGESRGCYLDGTRGGRSRKSMRQSFENLLRFLSESESERASVTEGRGRDRTSTTVGWGRLVPAKEK